MGREAEGQCRFRGQAGRVRALLEPKEVILRGEIRARLPRDDLSGWRAAGDVLHLLAGGEPLELWLGEREATAWVRALDKPLPDLRQKLGLGPDARGCPTGADQVPEVMQALEGAVAASPAEAAMLIAVLADQTALGAAVALAESTGLPIWCVHGKGRAAAVTNAQVRTAFRGAGWVDTKTSAVSDRWTATRYVRRRS